MWLAAALVLFLLAGACALAVARAGHLSGLVILQTASVLAVLALLAAAVALGESYLYLPALTLALVTGPGTQLYSHFLERWQ